MPEPYRCIVELYLQPQDKLNFLGDVFEPPHYRITTQPDGNLFQFGSALEKRVLLAQDERITIGRSSQMRITFPTTSPLFRTISRHHGDIYRVMEDGNPLWEYENKSERGSDMGEAVPLKTVGRKKRLSIGTHIIAIPHKSVAQLVVHVH